MTRYFADIDGHNEPTIWRQDGDALPIAMLRRCDLHHDGREELWAVLVAAIKREPFRCAICGDDSVPAECPDRHGWDDHGLCCVGACRVCQGYIEDDYQGEDL